MGEGIATTVKLIWRTVKEQPLRITVYLAAYPVLGLITFLLPLENTGQPIIAAGLIWALGTYVQLPELRKAYRETKQQQELDKKLESFDRILRQFEDRFAEDFLNLDNTDRENNIIPYSWNAFDDQVYRWIFLVYLQQSDQYNLEREDMAEFNREINELREQFSLQEPSDKDLRVAWGTYSVLCTDEMNIRLDEYSDRAFLENECFQQRFVQEYVAKERLITKLKEEKAGVKKEKKIVEDYRETLAKLYEDGKLDKYGIREALGDLDEHIERVITEKTHYFILLNEFYNHKEELKSQIISTLQEHGIDVYAHYAESNRDTNMTIAWDEGYGRFTGILAVCEEEYEPSEFYEKFVRDHLQESEGEGYLSVHRAEFKGDTIIEDTYRREEPGFGARMSLKARQVLTTGEERLKISLKDELIENYLNMNELLSVLPLNLFLRELDSDKKKVLIENNENLKDWAGINQLTDWTNPPKTTKEIAEHLQQNYFPDDTVEEWKENVEKIKSRAEEVRSAVRGREEKPVMEG